MTEISRMREVTKLVLEVLKKKKSLNFDEIQEATQASPMDVREAVARLVDNQQAKWTKNNNKVKVILQNVKLLEGRVAQRQRRLA